MRNLLTEMRKLRKRKRISQTQMATAIGVTPGYLCQVEKGHKSPNLSLLEDYCDELEIPLPIIHFLSLDDEYIAKDKIIAFRIVQPAMVSMIQEFFDI